MNFKLFIFILAIQFIFSISVGCLSENKNNYSSNDFVGSWYAAELPNISNDSNIPVEYTWTFFINNTMKSDVFFQNETSNYSLSLWYDFRINDTEICISSINNSLNEQSLQCFSFKFSDNNKRFALFQNEIIFIVFDKIN